MSLKIVLAASALALLATGAAKAAEPIQQPPSEVPVFTWTGFYLGIQGGYVWTNLDVSPSGLSSNDLNGGMFGGYAGYNFEYAPWVFGIEGDFNGTWNNSSGVIVGPPAAIVDIGTDWLASIRARVGYSYDRALIYGTGGVAWTSATADVTTALGTFSGDKTLTGWTLGGGVEYAFTDNWLGRVEYRYYGFDNADLDGAGPLGNVDLNSQTVSVGIAYKF
jgi:outer membrane immunogenic protein